MISRENSINSDNHSRTGESGGGRLKKIVSKISIPWQIDTLATPLCCKQHYADYRKSTSFDLRQLSGMLGGISSDSIRHSRLDYPARDRIRELSNACVLRHNGNVETTGQREGEAKVLMIDHFIPISLSQCSFLLAPFSFHIFPCFFNFNLARVARTTYAYVRVNVNSI